MGATWGIPQERLARIKALLAEVKSAGCNAVNTARLYMLFTGANLLKWAYGR
jgi:hypothetical protein